MVIATINPLALLGVSFIALVCIGLCLYGFAILARSLSYPSGATNPKLGSLFILIGFGVLFVLLAALLLP
jgi:tellurite resistance protein TehA-like permease